MLSHEIILNHVDDIFEQDMHAKRVLSFADATQGVIESGSLAIHAIGNVLSLASGLERKYAVKQVDRLLTNTKLNVWSLFDYWVPYVVAERTDIVVSMDWIESGEAVAFTPYSPSQTPPILPVVTPGYGPQSAAIF